MQPDSFGDDGPVLMSVDEVIDGIKQLSAMLASMVGSQEAYEQLTAVADEVSELSSLRGSIQ